MNNKRFIQYLYAKKTTDDRSLNLRVWLVFVNRLKKLKKQKQARILELGAGIGTMCERLLEAADPSGMSYTMLDDNPALLKEAEVRLKRWYRKNTSGIMPDLSFHALEAGAWLSGRPPDILFDVILAHAFLDLVDIRVILGNALSLMDPGGLVYLTINYDGLTDFYPSLPADEEIIGCYHESMRAVKGAYRGTDKSCAGIFRYLADNRIPILDAGASDWAVVPRLLPDGSSGTSVSVRHSLHGGRFGIGAGLRQRHPDVLD